MAAENRELRNQLADATQASCGGGGSDDNASSGSDDDASGSASDDDASGSDDDASSGDAGGDDDATGGDDDATGGGGGGGDDDAAGDDDATDGDDGDADDGDHEDDADGGGGDGNADGDDVAGGSGGGGGDDDADSDDDATGGIVGGDDDPDGDDDTPDEVQTESPVAGTPPPGGIETEPAGPTEDPCALGLCEETVCEGAYLLPANLGQITSDPNLAEAAPIPCGFYIRTGVVGVLTAFLGDFLEIASSLQGFYGVEDLANHRFVAARLAGVDVVFAMTGIGSDNAVITVQSLFDAFPLVEDVVFMGIGGGINPARSIGDVAIPQFWVNPMSQKFTRPLPIVGAPGFTEEFFDFGVDFPTKYATLNDTVCNGNCSYGDEFVSLLRASCDGCGTVSVAADLAQADGAAVFPSMAVALEMETFTSPVDAYRPVPPSKFKFEVPFELLALAEEVLLEFEAGEFNLTSRGVDPITGATFVFDPTLSVGGLGVSSNTFVDNDEYRGQLFDTYGAEVVDMESASLMHACETNGKRCLVIRSLSDLAGGEELVNAILSFISFAAANSVAVMVRLLPKIQAAAVAVAEAANTTAV